MLYVYLKDRNVPSYCINPLTAGAEYIGFFTYYYHIQYRLKP